eukprot:TRINITY_DN6526_c0_g1_i3.p1 TRINITY_DN6526_c0_g1~~TRINITY_DN6526_c0_g1_i3.p1  ORF type:complete len:113 (-),score=8.84 TRINITY_DN6526_c0_g1_i3:108-446(-)
MNFLLSSPNLITVGLCLSTTDLIVMASLLEKSPSAVEKKSLSFLWASISAATDLHFDNSFQRSKAKRLRNKKFFDDPYDASTNLDGVIQLGVAENKVGFFFFFFFLIIMHLG